ncbi:aldehyde dehydrogenase [Planosporangium flavigriseum]|uniref:Succinate-semialdehyde dehydrogenase n=1 Tax=Planosporangium flavigriseum TaxID=373681 RepID=A0A8J3LTK6_9ACTN|nr:aldehyde dehydrogenase family protein [Planosporangium flavigriseum]NJC65304.1 aldehyde dehydrogenase [Planosporangium flavigriseum]GIG73341.1 succinate-semialdehyde dehydrogenase [Planosporangium flavigriseum]
MTDTEKLVHREWSAAESTRRITITNPADGQELFAAPVASPAEVDTAVGAARSAAAEWARTAAAERAAAVHRAADAVAARADDLARLTTLEMGKPLGDARGGVDAGVGTLRQYAELGPVHRGRSLNGGFGATDLMVYEPRGVVAAITPWNDPVAVSCGLIGAALVTGNTVVYKPSERTPATGWLLARILSEHLPAGVLNLLLGDGAVGARLVEQPVDVVAHVGACATGRAIARAAAGTRTKVLLENGGNDPLIIDADVDPEWAAAQAALGAFANAGQICVSVERIYVHEAIADPFLAALAARAEALRMGPGLEAGTELAPLVDRRLREHVHGHVEQAVAGGAKLLAGGDVPEGPGAYYPATVLAGCTDDMAVMREETFGPVAPVAVVGTFDEALARAGQGEYGLAATVLTRDLAHAIRASRELPAGTVKVNNVFGGAPGGAAHPRRASGQGYGYGPELLDEMTQTKVVHLGAPPA